MFFRMVMSVVPIYGAKVNAKARAISGEHSCCLPVAFRDARRDEVVNLLLDPGVLRADLNLFGKLSGRHQAPKQSCSSLRRQDLGHPPRQIGGGEGFAQQ